MSTAPRNITWTVLDLFDGATGEFTCIYNKPVEYGKWLSRNPGKPRIVYKLGGELQLGWPTKLLVLPGYDAERVKQLIDTFEPVETVLGCHDGEDLENMERKVTAVKIRTYEPAVRGFDYNAYSGDLGLQKIMSEASDLFKDANVIMASLGPKVTAIPLYRIHKKFANSALVYTPSKEFEQDYSKGIGEHVVIDPRTGKRGRL